MYVTEKQPEVHGQHQPFSLAVLTSLCSQHSLCLRLDEATVCSQGRALGCHHQLTQVDIQEGTRVLFWPL